MAELCGAMEERVMEVVDGAKAEVVEKRERRRVAVVNFMVVVVEEASEKL